MISHENHTNGPRYHTIITWQSHELHVHITWPHVLITWNSHAYCMTFTIHKLLLSLLIQIFASGRSTNKSSHLAPSDLATLTSCVTSAKRITCYINKEKKPFNPKGNTNWLLQKSTNYQNFYPSRLTSTFNYQYMFSLSQ